MMLIPVIIIGKGRVGKHIETGIDRSKFVPVFDRDPASGSIVIDARASYDNDNYWSSCMKQINDTIKIALQCDTVGALALIVCSSEWAERDPSGPYGASKLILEAWAREHNRFGRTPVVVDRIGTTETENLSEWEEAVKVSPAALAERMLSKALHSIDKRNRTT